MSSHVSSKKRVPSRQDLERVTKRTLSMETALTNEALASCNMQTESPIYQLPKELRDIIFALATAPYDDPQQLYKKTDSHYRPGHTARHKTDTSLLLTCRRTWLETNALPMLQAKHTLWFRSALNLRNVRYLQIFVNKHQAETVLRDALETWVFPAGKLPDCKPKVLQITLRRLDWLRWRTGSPLPFNHAWVQDILDSPVLAELEEFRLELETLESTKAQQDEIVEYLMRLEGKPRRSSAVYPDRSTASQLVRQASPVTWQWTGPASVNGKQYDPYRGLGTLRYHVAMLTWRRVDLRDRALGCPNVAIPTESALHRGLAYDRTPLEIMRKHPCRWPRLAQMRFQVERRAAQQVGAVEEARRELFERVVGDVEVVRVLGGWAAEGSLLRFGDYDAG
ncbi:hypothetical protein LTR08_000771 [Meristemomyces frigidus]|nr:hypothetical protein LTR08_000771 [Meristemomyces frigidus]